MKVATILFTYHRSKHTEQVLNGLKENYVLPEKLFVFQDGLKPGEDRTEWDKVNSLINNINFCPTEIIVSEKNKGLAKSVIAGINYVFQKYDAVIVLEDDCVPSRNFINFMLQCFEKYEREKSVYCVSGYALPIGLQAKDDADICFMGRTCSWGWGTWRDRWAFFSIDYEILERVMGTQTSSIRLAEWGKDMIGIFEAQKKGKCDSWAIFWGLATLEQKGVCVFPYQSLIQNIGFDGSGRHSGNNPDSIFKVETENQGFCKYVFPKTIQLREAIKKAFALNTGYGSYTAMQEDKSMTHAFVYGLGGCFMGNEREICQRFYIEGFIDLNKSGYFAGKPIIKPDELSGSFKKKIIIALADKNEIEKVRDHLGALGIAPNNIISAQDFT